jgi:hypothetical protein
MLKWQSGQWESNPRPFVSIRFDSARFGVFHA